MLMNPQVRRGRQGPSGGRCMARSDRPFLSQVAQTRQWYYNDPLR